MNKRRRLTKSEFEAVQKHLSANREKRRQKAWTEAHNDAMARVNALLNVFPTVTRSDAIKAVEGPIAVFDLEVDWRDDPGVQETLNMALSSVQSLIIVADVREKEDRPMTENERGLFLKDAMEELYQHRGMGFPKPMPIYRNPDEDERKPWMFP